MNDRTLLGPWVRRFLLEYLVTERNLAHNTQCSYRDALILLIPFVAGKLHQSVDRLTVLDLRQIWCAFFWRTWSSPEGVQFQPATSDWPQFMLWLGLSESTARSTSPGVVKFVPSLSKRLARQ